MRLAMACALLLSACGSTQSAGDAPKPAATAAPAPVIDSKEAVDRAFAEAIARGESGDWAGAATEFARLRRQVPERVDVVVNHGIALERSGRVDAAMRAYEAALQLEAHHPVATSNLARVLVTSDKLPRARKLLADGLRVHPDHPNLLAINASLLRQSGNSRRAAQVARRVLLRDQNNLEAIKLLGLSYADQGKAALAETFFRNALAIDERDPSIHANLGLVEYRQGEHQRALASFERAIALDPGHAVAHANLGAIALKFRDYRRASEAYERAVKAGLVTCETVSALGYAYEGAQEPTQALSSLDRAYPLCNQDAELLYSAGTIAMGQLQDNARALRYFERYTELKKALAKDHPVHLMIESIRQMESASKDAPEGNG
ncbi:MAG: tetratricopeptide repeat protein [Myxococcota bacterium]